jgi:hypothetical protein
VAVEPASTPDSTAASPLVIPAAAALDSAVSAGGGLSVYYRDSTVVIIARTAGGMWSGYRWTAGSGDLRSVGLYSTKAAARTELLPMTGPRDP